MSNLLERFAAAVESHPDKVAIVDGKGRETTFREIDQRARDLAARWHAKGIRPDDRVLLAVPLKMDLYASLAALWSLGATVVLPEPSMGINGLRHAEKVTRPKAYCGSGWLILLKFLLPALWRLPLLRLGAGIGSAPNLPVSADDIALISFTSGTTGAPKAIPRSHRFLLSQHDAVSSLLASDAEERDLVAFPVFTLVNLADGRTTILPSWKMNRLGDLTPSDIEAWLRKQKVTRILAPPAVCEVLADATLSDDLHTIFSGGGPVFPDLIQRLRTRTSASIVCIYGSTEAEPIAHLNANEILPEDMEEMARGRGLLVGDLVDQVQVRIVDREVQVAGPHVNESYLDTSQNAENKIVEGSTTWHRTGDAGFLDKDNRLWLLGRVGSEAQSGRGPVFPFSIEIAARSWPGVERCALISVSGKAILVIEGNRSHQALWVQRARELGIEKTIEIKYIPMDKRHHSKVDRVRLRRLLAKQAQ